MSPLSSHPSRRGPHRRLAAFLSLALALSLGLAAPARGWASSGKSPASGKSGEPATLSVGTVAYVEAAAWFARHGYRVVPQAPVEKGKSAAAPTASAESRLELTGAGGRIELKAGSREIEFQKLRVFLGEPVVWHRGAAYVSRIDLERFLAPMLRPSALAARPLKTIVIDAGHGGNDTGTRNAAKKLDEKTFTIDVARRLARLLAADGGRVILHTREDDRYVALPDRAAFANTAKADLFVSIHFNAVANNPSVRGTETYVLTPRHQRSTSSALPSADDKLEQPGNRFDAYNAVLGQRVHRELLARLGTEDRGYKRARFAVLRLVECPAVLVEAGYLSNDAEAALIATEAYRQRIAEGVHAAILGYEAATGGLKKPRT